MKDIQTIEVIYFDCFAGAAGDMIIGSLLHLFGDNAVPQFNALLDSLNVPEVRMHHEIISVCGIRSTDVRFKYPSQPLRHYSDLANLIHSANLSEWVTESSLSTLRHIAAAESEVHGIPEEEVHFHEIGAMDTVIDIVGTYYLLEKLGRPQVFSSALNVGRGTVRTEHGVLPVPAPATALLLKGIPIYSNQMEGELLTPTGAALLRSMTKHFGDIPAMIPLAVGYGAGDRRSDTHANVLRVIAGTLDENKEPSGLQKARMVMIETNMDDYHPENSEHLMKRLFANGARDVFFTPLIMKKSRCGVLLSVLCDVANTLKLEEIIFRETTTFGVRLYTVNRHCVKRTFTEVTVFGHPIRVKVGYLNNAPVKFHPEYADCQKVAQLTSRPIWQIQHQALTEAASQIPLAQADSHPR